MWQILVGLGGSGGVATYIAIVEDWEWWWTSLISLAFVVSILLVFAGHRIVSGGGVSNNALVIDVDGDNNVTAVATGDGATAVAIKQQNPINSPNVIGNNNEVNIGEASPIGLSGKPRVRWEGGERIIEDKFGTIHRGES